MAHCSNNHRPSSSRQILASQPAALILKTLPRTLEDAIFVTTQLGERYLWIDAICIDQSNEAEKSEQLALMGDIYRAGLATIIPACSDSVHCGIPGVVSGTRYTGQIHHVILNNVLQEVMDPIDTHLRRSRWSRRAWTYQEACLSARCLLFTCEQAYLICEEKIQGEAYVLKTPYTGYKDGDNWQYPRFDGAPHSWNSCLSFARYAEMINDYTSRALSYSADSLAALSGMLSQLEQETETSIYQGHPVCDLGRSLLWSVNYDSTTTIAGNIRSVRPEFFQRFNDSQYEDLLIDAAIPTWSWASSRTRLTYFKIGHKQQNAFLVTALEYRRKNDLPEPIGELWSVKITPPVPTCTKDSRVKGQELQLTSFSIPLSAQLFGSGGFKKYQPPREKAFQMYSGMTELNHEYVYTNDHFGELSDDEGNGECRVTVVLDQSPQESNLLENDFELLLLTKEVYQIGKYHSNLSAHVLPLVVYAAGVHYKRAGLAAIPIELFKEIVDVCVRDDDIPCVHDQNGNKLPKLKEFILI